MTSRDEVHGTAANKVAAPASSCAPSSSGDTEAMPQLNFADSIRRAILDAPVSRYRLSKVLDVTETTLSGFVRGRHWIGEELLNAIAGELGLRVVAGRKRKARRKPR
jgi:hypothetical protein